MMLWGRRFGGTTTVTEAEVRAVQVYWKLKEEAKHGPNCNCWWCIAKQLPS